MIPYGRQEISEEDIAQVIKVLRSDFLTQGPQVPQFENAICNYVNCKYGVAVNSATSALHIACLALDIGCEDLVWTSANTFAASANCALYCGAVVDFVDIDINTYNICPIALEDKLRLGKKNGRLPKAVIPVHFSGQPCNMREIHRLSLEYGFKIIEDASHAIGATYNGKLVGSGQYSDITVFSFHPVKIITTGEGGMAVTNNLEYYEKMKLHRSHGITSDNRLMGIRPGNEIWNYQQISLGYNYRLTDIAAALGLSQLTRLPEFIRARNKIAKNYGALLRDLPIILPYQNIEFISAYHLYVIRLDANKTSKSQRQIYSFLQENGINVNLHYIPVYRHPFYEKLGFPVGYCQHAERYFQTALSIPIFPGLTMGDQEYVAASLRTAFKG
jgi:UDP-4-amino-4,6-dideoxy-N-acetyl-beta-L-altrosamine transaminase